MNPSKKFSALPTGGVRPIRIAQVLILLSMVWSLTTLLVAGFSLWAGEGVASPIVRDFQASFGFFAVVYVVLVLHFFALRATEAPPQATPFLGIISASLLFVGLITRATVGLYLYPAALLVFIAAVLAVRSAGAQSTN